MGAGAGREGARGAVIHGFRRKKRGISLPTGDSIAINQNLTTEHESVNDAAVIDLD